MDETCRRRLGEVAARWNAIERRMKEIELFRGEAMIAAVNELRYAGRRNSRCTVVLEQRRGQP
jgi:hypothetical protein